MKIIRNLILAIAVLGLAGTVIWYYASGQYHKDWNRNNTAAAENQIKTNWTKFFAGSTTAQGKIALLQNGQQFAQVIDAEAQSPTAKATSATVSGVSVNGNTATVTYTVDIAGQPVLSDQKSQAVNENGTWKVSDTAFCGLLQLSGMVLPNCHQ